MESVTQSVVLHFSDSWVIAILWPHKGDVKSRYIRLETTVEKYYYTKVMLTLVCDVISVDS